MSNLNDDKSSNGSNEKKEENGFLKLAKFVFAMGIAFLAIVGGYNFVLNSDLPESEKSESDESESADSDEKNPNRTYIGSVNISTVESDVTGKISLDDVKSILFDLNFVNLELKINENLTNEAVLSVKGSKKTDIFDISVDEKDKLTITEDISLGLNKTDLIVEIPLGNYNGIEILNVSGAVNINNLVAQNLNIETTSGNIALDNLKSNNISLESSSGDLKVINVESSKLFAYGNSGKIEINDSIFNNVLIENSVSSVKLKNIVANDLVNISTYAGAVDLENLNSKIIELKTTSGGINGLVLNTEDLTAHSVSGQINLDFEKQDVLQIDLTTVSGNIKCAFDKEQKISDNGQRDTRGKFVFDKNSDNSFVFSTVTGRVTAEER